MATHAGHFIQNQNLNVHLDGAPVGGKGNVPKAQKKGGLGQGRKALNDISNSGKPSALQPSRKHNSMNVIPIGEDLGVSKTKISVGGKINVSKAPEKLQVGGRKALSDLTNSGKPSANQGLKKSQCKKLIPCAIPEEGFLHNHENCIKAQRKTVDIDYFSNMVGLDHDILRQLATPRAPPSLSRDSKLESPVKHLIVEEISDQMIEDQWKLEFSNDHESEVCGSPKSPKPFMHWKDYGFSDFIMGASP